MCDYSLHLVATRVAKVGDRLATTAFPGSMTRGFSALGALDVAVCLRPGTELAFDEDIGLERVLRLFGAWRTGHRLARFRQVNPNKPHTHHDALELPNGRIVLVTQLLIGQTLTVLQLPALAEHAPGLPQRVADEPGSRSQATKSPVTPAHRVY